MKIEPLLAHLLCLKIHSRTLNIMKVAVFMMFFCVFQLLASNGKAQNAVIELSSNSVTVETLFAEIKDRPVYIVKDTANVKKNRSKDTDGQDVR